MAGHEPGGFDVVLVEKAEESISAFVGAEDTTGDIAHIGGLAIRSVEPSSLVFLTRSAL